MIAAVFAVFATFSAEEPQDAAAQCQLGLDYLNGVVAPLDEEKGVFWLEKAAAQGHAQAQYNLGLYYARFSDDASSRLAIKWLGEAARRDWAPAQYNLAKLYLNERHLAGKTPGAGRRAIALLVRAAANGHAGARKMLEDLGVEAPECPKMEKQ